MKLASYFNIIETYSLEKDYEMSFVLSATDWKDSYNDLSDPESEELKEKVLTAVRLPLNSCTLEYFTRLQLH